jgi:hypothetical protein
VSDKSNLDARVLAAARSFACDPAQPHPLGMKLAHGDEGRCVYARAQDAVNADGGESVGLIAVMRTFNRLKKQGVLLNTPIKGIYLVDMGR